MPQDILADYKTLPNSTQVFLCSSSSMMGCAGRILSNIFKPVSEYTKLTLGSYTKDAILAYWRSIGYRFPQKFIDYSTEEWASEFFKEDKEQPHKILMVGVNSITARELKKWGFVEIYKQDNRFGGSEDFRYLVCKLEVTSKGFTKRILVPSSYINKT